MIDQYCLPTQSEINMLLIVVGFLYSNITTKHLVKLFVSLGSRRCKWNEFILLYKEIKELDMIKKNVRMNKQ